MYALRDDWKMGLVKFGRINLKHMWPHLILIGISAASFFPIVWMFLTSIKNPLDVYVVPPKWVFTPVIDNYARAFRETKFGENIINSFIVSLASTLISVFVGSLAAYSMARFKVGGAYGPVGLLTLRIMPPIVPIIPIFILYRTIGLYGSLQGLILLYSVFNLPTVILMMISFFVKIPREIEEAAYLDGCSEIQTFMRIILPLSMFGLTATAAFIFILCWNEFLFAVILTAEATKTAPVALFGFITHLGIPAGPVSAIGVLMIIPVVIIFLIFQTYIVRGLTAPYIEKI